VVSLLASVVYLLLWLYIGLLFIRFVIDWVQVFARSWTPSGPALVVLEVVYTATDPPILFLRRFIPPLRLGSVALDLSFILVLIICYVLLMVAGSLR
jgi:YggT family protein